MRPGQPSETAVRVCMGRAVAHGVTRIAKLSDPTALALLPDDARARVERVRSATAPRGFRARYERGLLRGLSNMMVARTVEIDDAIRAAPSPQLVILGAGLDGRAWRMFELRDVAVFEVDHPDSQRVKRARAFSLPRAAREVRFASVDFERVSLDGALAAAGHDPEQPTTWIWEGVVMYLALRHIEATLAVIERRSAARSRLIVVYHTPAWMLPLVRIAVRRLGEPLRSSFTAAAMRALLARHGFAVSRDENVPEIAAALSSELGHAARIMTHLRIVTADMVRAP
ncbi:MAG: class I SAM-dependent methyltransferase [Polyangiaceae bacterium]